MKKVNIYPIKSILHDEDFIFNERSKLFSSLNKLTSFTFNIVSLKELYNGDLALILVESGGSENEFLKVIDKLKEPFIFLTFNTNNSLAASLEILSYLNRINKKGEILHGDKCFIANRLKALIKEKEND